MAVYSKEIIERFRAAATASVADACDIVVKDKRCVMDYAMRPRVKERKIVGPAVTVLDGAGTDPQPPTHIIDTLDNAEGGEVIVVSLKENDLNCALWGGLMTAGAYVNGLEGAVLNCGVRDLTEIRRDYPDFEIFSQSIVPVTMVSRYVTIDKNLPVECEGVIVNPGDLIVGDIDGVICIPQEHVEEVLAMAEDIDKKEAIQTKAIFETKSFGQGLAKFNRF